MVCTGNICRSPLAAQLLAVRLAENGLARFVFVESAGLSAVVGDPMDAVPASISQRQGGDPSTHLARQLSTAIVNRADLILTMTRQQRDETVKLFPRASQRSFSIGELTQLIGPTNDQTRAVYAADTAERLRQQTLRTGRNRSSARTRSEDDIDDPYRGSLELHETIGQQITLACSELAAGFEGWASAPAVAEPIW
jgi:protein-tyrosine phosphatase